ncbi:MAG: hypothetical protein PWR07_1840 [Bacillota bacterium]|nr:hypothetical protein [Bacillota bacterium]
MVPVHLEALRVSTHASAREATVSARSRTSPRACFNPRLRAGGDLSLQGSPSQEFTFQPTPPRGRRPAGRPRPAPQGGRFNPRLRAGGDSSGFTALPSRPSFNPRLRAGGDGVAMALDAATVSQVSTHASAREATLYPVGTFRSASLFQPTPPRGRRPSRARAPASSCSCFNPRLRAGGDAITEMLDRLLWVSTHASAREATISIGTGAPPTSGFQPTPPRGRRLGGCDAIDAFLAFQPTPPRGRRPGPARTG